RYHLFAGLRLRLGDLFRPVNTHLAVGEQSEPIPRRGRQSGSQRSKEQSYQKLFLAQRSSLGCTGIYFVR
ncbi:MAG: hypothetical protein RSA17_08720, partial [Ruthenibacterium sp.]